MEWSVVSLEEVVMEGRSENFRYGKQMLWLDCLIYKESRLETELESWKIQSVQRNSVERESDKWRPDLKTAVKESNIRVDSTRRKAKLVLSTIYRNSRKLLKRIFEARDVMKLVDRITQTRNGGAHEQWRKL